MKEEAVPSILVPGDKPPAPNPRQPRLAKRRREPDEPDIKVIGVQEEVTVGESGEESEDETCDKEPEEEDPFVPNPFGEKCSIETLEITQRPFHFIQVYMIIVIS